jgi:hypothetical protein
MGRERSRFRLLVLIALSVLASIALARNGRPYGLWLPRYGEIALWSMTLYWALLFFRPTATTRSVTQLALLLSVAVECSQLYQAPWIHELRLTPVGAAVLGAGFHRIDVLCLALGALLASILDTPFQVAEGAPPLRAEEQRRGVYDDF